MVQSNLASTACREIQVDDDATLLIAHTIDVKIPPDIETMVKKFTPFE
jgi:hypothetical protein